MKENKGITLIALIITIVILLILLAVSVDLIIDGKIFTSAEKAVNGTNEKVAQQQGRIDELMEEWKKIEQNQCAHNWEEWSVIKEATETEEGTKTRTCSLCGKTETQIIAKQDENYVVEETAYYYTLQEAIDNAQDGATIRVLKDSTETVEIITIDKSIILNTNGKTINCTKIEINQNKNVVINGNGIILGNPINGSFIINEGNLETNNVTINSSVPRSYICSTITNFRKSNF